MLRKVVAKPAFAAVMAAALMTGVGSAGSGELLPPAGSQKSYVPIQSISYDFASKSVSGYFLPQDGKCLMVLMMTDKSDPDQSVKTRPARLRVLVPPGEFASLDSEAAEGVLQSLSFSCGESATTLSVVEGDGTEPAPLAQRID